MSSFQLRTKPATTVWVWVRHTVVEAKQRPLSPGHRLPDRIVRRIPQSSSCHFHFFPFWSRLIFWSLGVSSGPSQECLPCFGESPNGESPGCSPGSLSFSARVTGCLSGTVLWGHLSLSDATVGIVGHFVPLVAWRDHWGKRDAFLSSESR